MYRQGETNRASPMGDVPCKCVAGMTGMPSSVPGCCAPPSTRRQVTF